jgi:hypothetical protein
MTLRFAPFRLAIVLSSCLLATGARGQEPTLYLGDSSNPTTAKEVKNILLRPNTGTPFYAYIGNTSPNDRTLTAVLLNAAGRTIARVDNIAAPANSRVPVTFKGDDKPLALTGSQVRLQLLDEKNKEIAHTDLDLAFQAPTQYAKATAGFTGARDANNELKVTVTASPVSGGPIKVKLDLSQIPGLVPESIKDGAFSGEIPASGGSAVLVARNLRFTGEPKKGWVGVTVDGYDRAFLFETAFDGSTPQRPPVENVILVAVRPTAQPTENFPVKIEVDQPTRADEYIEFGFDKSGSGTFETRILPGDRDRAATLRIGGNDGALVFGSTVKDWAFPLDATGVLGPRSLRARLMTPKGPTADPVNDTELRADLRQVMFDNSPAEVKLTAPAQHAKGTPINVTIAAADPESGVDRVLVFVGDAPAADVRGPVRGKVYAANPPTTAGGPFTATLPTPDSKGRIIIGTRVFNGAGLPNDALVEVDLVDPAGGGKAANGTIKGVVEAGTSPGRKQQNKPVMLLDEKQTVVIKKTETNDKGEFIFKDVPPGNYVLRSDKPSDYAVAKKAVTVEAGKTSEVALELMRARSKK